MKKATAIIVLMALTLVIIFPALLIAGVKAQGDYSINRVTHTVKVLYNGYILVNDTVELSAQTTSFALGFPHKYGQYIQTCIAYNLDNRLQTFPVTLNAPLEDRVGFYGVMIDLSQGTPQAFTVESVLSSDLLTQNLQNSDFTLDFPAFPSLTKDAAIFNGSVVLPQGAQYVGGSISGLNYSQTNLAAFTYNPATVTFSVTGTAIQVFDINQLNREIRVDGSGAITGSDSYFITNNFSAAIEAVEVVLPANASNPTAEDQLGRTLKTVIAAVNTSRYKITFKLPLDANKATSFRIDYNLPVGVYLKQDSNGFDFNITLFKNIDYYIDQASITFVLPEGAKLVGVENSLAGIPYGVDRNVFQETVTVNKLAAGAFDDFSVNITYDYSPLWLAFRPTLWMWALAIVGAVVVVAWRRPKAVARIEVPAMTMRLRPEYVRSFVESYEEKMKIVFELDTLETRVQKGKIPRRRYKVQRKTLETRLAALSRDLAEFKEKLRSVGGHYSDLMRQLEVSETEINEASSNLKSIETRHGRGELSLEAYRKLVGEYQRRKERAENSVNGILLRLREEIR